MGSKVFGVGEFAGRYSKDIFDERRGAVAALFQQSLVDSAGNVIDKKYLLDADLNDAGITLFSLLQRATFGAFPSQAVREAWKIVASQVSTSNNFALQAFLDFDPVAGAPTPYIVASPSKPYAFARYFVGGLPALLTSGDAITGLLDRETASTDEVTQREINARRTGLNAGVGSATQLIDANIRFPYVAGLGGTEGLLGRAGFSLVGNALNPNTVLLSDNTATVLQASGVIPNLTVGDLFYRLTPSAPAAGRYRIDLIYLDVYLGELDAAQDPNLLHPIAGGTEHARRMIVRQALMICPGIDLALPGGSPFSGTGITKEIERALSDSAYDSEINGTELDRLAISLAGTPFLDGTIAYQDSRRAIHFVVPIAAILRQDGVAAITSDVIYDLRDPNFGSSREVVEARGNADDLAGAVGLGHGYTGLPTDESLTAATDTARVQPTGDGYVGDDPSDVPAVWQDDGRLRYFATLWELGGEIPYLTEQVSLLFDTPVTSTIAGDLHFLFDDDDQSGSPPSNEVVVNVTATATAAGVVAQLNADGGFSARAVAVVVAIPASGGNPRNYVGIMSLDVGITSQIRINIDQSTLLGSIISVAYRDTFPTEVIDGDNWMIIDSGHQPRVIDVLNSAGTESIVGNGELGDGRFSSAPIYVFDSLIPAGKSFLLRYGAETAFLNERGDSYAGRGVIDARDSVDRRLDIEHHWDGSHRPNIISTPQLIDDSVTLAKMAGGGAHLVFGTDGSGNPELMQIQTAQILDLAVTTDKLGPDAVINPKVADDAIRTENIDEANTLSSDGELYKDAGDGDKIAIRLDPANSIILSGPGGSQYLLVTSAILITDLGGYFTAGDVEEALQEIGAALAAAGTTFFPVDHENLAGSIFPGAHRDQTTHLLDGSGDGRILFNADGGGTTGPSTETRVDNTKKVWRVLADDTLDELLIQQATGFDGIEQVTGWQGALDYQSFKTLSGSIHLANNISLLGKETGGTSRILAKMNVGDETEFGNISNVTNIRGLSIEIVDDVSADINLQNDIAIRGRTTGAALKNLVQIDVGDFAGIGDPTLPTKLQGSSVQITGPVSARITMANAVDIVGTETGATLRNLIVLDVADNIHVGDASNNLFLNGLTVTIVGPVAANIVMNNDIELRGKETGGTERNLINLNPSNGISVGSAANAMNLNGTQITAVSNFIINTSLTLNDDKPIKGPGGENIITLSTDTDVFTVFQSAHAVNLNGNMSVVTLLDIADAAQLTSREYELRRTAVRSTATDGLHAHSASGNQVLLKGIEDIYIIGDTNNTGGGRIYFSRGSTDESATTEMGHIDASGLTVPATKDVDINDTTPIRLRSTAQQFQANGGTGNWDVAPEETRGLGKRVWVAVHLFQSGAGSDVVILDSVFDWRGRIIEWRLVRGTDQTKFPGNVGTESYYGLNWNDTDPNPTGNVEVFGVNNIYDGLGYSDTDGDSQFNLFVNLGVTVVTIDVDQSSGGNLRLAATTSSLGGFSWPLYGYIQCGPKYDS